MSRDVLVGDVGAAIDPDGAHQRIAWRGLEPLVRDQHHFDRQPFGRAEYQFLYILRRRVCINPNFQAGYSLLESA